jgi:hypothetical protein
MIDQGQKIGHLLKTIKEMRGINIVGSVLLGGI